MAFQTLKSTYRKTNPIFASDMLFELKSAQMLVGPDGAKAASTAVPPRGVHQGALD